MSLEQGILLGVIIGAVAAVSELARRNRTLRAETDRTSAERDIERAHRLVYERALGLPVFSNESRDADLWARAAQGDEIASLILEERLNVELFDQFEPPAFNSSGDSNTHGTSSQDSSSRL